MGWQQCLNVLNCIFFRVLKIKFSKIKLLVTTCVKVERKCVYTEGVTSTSGFEKKWADLSLDLALLVKNKYTISLSVGTLITHINCFISRIISYCIILKRIYLVVFIDPQQIDNHLPFKTIWTIYWLPQEFDLLYHLS